MQAGVMLVSQPCESYWSESIFEAFYSNPLLLLLVPHMHAIVLLFKLGVFHFSTFSQVHFKAKFCLSISKFTALLRRLKSYCTLGCSSNLMSRISSVPDLVKLIRHKLAATPCSIPTSAMEGCHFCFVLLCFPPSPAVGKFQTNAHLLPLRRAPSFPVLSHLALCKTAQ